jgi:magnesium-dependent phosphatase 1
VDFLLTDQYLGPLERPANALNQVVDKYGEQISFYKDVPHILHMVHARGRGEGADSEDKVIIAACSRTHAPHLYAFKRFAEYTVTEPYDNSTLFLLCRARQCLQLLHLQPSQELDSVPRSAMSYFDELEIYPCTFLFSRFNIILPYSIRFNFLASKLKHFKALHERTGIPYTDMLFFDDELRNIEVEKLGKR